MLLLVIDPDTVGSRALQRQLTARQVDVLVTDNPADGLLQAGTMLPDAVLAASDVPPMRGCEIARALYGRTGIPTIVGVAPDDADGDAQALAAGAIASVARPYRLEQILPVLGALSRKLSAPEPVRVGRLLLDPAAHEVHIGDRRIDLPQREFDLLHLLMTHAGQVVTRRQIHQLLWNADDAGSNTLAVHIKRLRARLGHGRGDPSITSVRGRGYRLDRRHDDNS